MKTKRNCILLAASAIGAIIALASSSITLLMLENKGDVCYLMKRKAKKALRQMESKIEDKLDC